MTSRTVGAAGVGAFLFLTAWCVAHAVPRIESTLESRTALALLGARLPLDEVVFEGRNATLRRSLASARYADHALRIVRDVPGVRAVHVASGAP